MKGLELATRLGKSASALEKQLRTVRTSLFNGGKYPSKWVWSPENDMDDEVIVALADSFLDEAVKQALQIIDEKSGNKQVAALAEKETQFIESQSIINQLQSQLNQSRQLAQQHKSDFDKTSKQVIDLTGQLTQFRQNVETIKGNFDNSAKRANALDTELTQSRQLAQKYKSDFDNLTKLVNSKEDELTKFRQIVETAKLNFDNLTKENNGFRQIVETQRIDFDDLTKLNNEFRQKVETFDKLTKENIEFRQIVETLTINFDKSSKENVEFRQIVETQRVTFDNLTKLVNSKEDELVRFRQNVEIANGNFDNSTKRVLELERLLADSKRSAEQFKTDFDKSSKQIASLEADLKQFRQNVETQKANLNDSARQTRDLEGELFKIRQNVEIQGSEIVVLKRKNAALESELQSNLTELASLRQLRDSLIDEKNNLLGANGGQTGQLAAANARMTVLETANADLNDEVRRLSADKFELQSNVEELTYKFTNLNKTHSSVSTESESAANENARLIAALAASNSKIIELGNAHATVLKDLELVKKDNSLLSNELKQLTALYKALQDKFDALTQGFQDFKLRYYEFVMTAKRAGLFGQLFLCATESLCGFHLFSAVGVPFWVALPTSIGMAMVFQGSLIATSGEVVARSLVFGGKQRGLDISGWLVLGCLITLSVKMSWETKRVIDRIVPVEVNDTTLVSAIRLKYVDSFAIVGDRFKADSNKCFANYDKIASKRRNWIDAKTPKANADKWIALNNTDSMKMLSDIATLNQKRFAGFGELQNNQSDAINAAPKVRRTAWGIMLFIVDMVGLSLFMIGCLALSVYHRETGEDLNMSIWKRASLAWEKRWDKKLENCLIPKD